MNIGKHSSARRREYMFAPFGIGMRHSHAMAMAAAFSIWAKLSLPFFLLLLCLLWVVAATFFNTEYKSYYKSSFYLCYDCLFCIFFFARIRACQRDVCVVSVRRWQSQFSFDDSQNRLSECCLGWWAANVCRFDPHQTKHDDENNINIQPSAERAEALAHPPFHHFNMDYEEIQFAKLWK